MAEKLTKVLMKVAHSEKLEVCMETLRDEIEGVDRNRWLSRISLKREEGEIIDRVGAKSKHVFSVPSGSMVVGIYGDQEGRQVRRLSTFLTKAEVENSLISLTYL